MQKLSSIVMASHTVYQQLQRQIQELKKGGGGASGIFFKKKGGGGHLLGAIYIGNNKKGRGESWTPPGSAPVGTCDPDVGVY